MSDVIVNAKMQQIRF